MDNRNLRWLLLGTFAIFNLVFWVAVAAGVALLVSPDVNLGVETFVRDLRATAVTAWQEAPTRVSELRSRPSTRAGNPEAAGQTAIQGAVEASEASLGDLAPPPATQSADAAVVRRTPAPTVGTAGDAPVPESVETPVSAPLLLSDPKLEGLARIQTEMARSAEGRAVQIRYQEEALNRELAALGNHKQDWPFSDVYVDLRTGRVFLTGDVEVLGVDVQTEVVASIVATDCLPNLQIENVSMAGVLTPGFFREKIEEVLHESLSWYTDEYPLCLERIVLENDRVTVYGSRR